MKKPRDNDKIVIQKIIKYCNDIEKLLQMFGNTFEDFNSNFAFQYACGMCIIQIGELTTRLSEDFKNQHSEIEWNQIKALRNIHAHDYESVKFKITWNTLTKDIPALKKSLQAILEVM